MCVCGVLLGFIAVVFFCFMFLFILVFVYFCSFLGLFSADWGLLCVGVFGVFFVLCVVVLLGVVFFWCFLFFLVFDGVFGVCRLCFE